MKDKFFVPFETAQALKAAGYNEECKDWYDSKGVLWSNDTFEPNNSDLAEMQYSAPTYHEVVDWLKGKKVRIYAEYCKGWAGFIDNGEAKEVEATAVYSTREEALNAAILKALEMI